MGDTIVSFDGLPVRHMDDLLAALSADRVGKPVGVRALRAGTLIDLTLTVGERGGG
jgi:S1-C subfamily serine protease